MPRWWACWPGCPGGGVYGVPASEYLHKSLAALTWTHLWIGLFKATLYAALVAWPAAAKACTPAATRRPWARPPPRAVVKGLVWIVSAACATTVVLQSMGY
jgi:phospholipid/cholesterol/gamma-HCH transport system permease protein